jgi:hypothetical protein
MPNAQITIKNTSDKTANPVTFRILFFKIDDSSMWFSVGGGDITLLPGEVRKYTPPFPKLKANISGARAQQAQVAAGKTISFNGVTVTTG